jgi:regulator of protease activity HflC (stomatin/prohibitin superfamily)
MLITLGIVSVTISFLVALVGLFFLLSRKKGEDGVTGSGVPRDEEKDFWQHFGLVDDSPNLIRAIVAGNENTGPIIGFITNVLGKKYDPITKKMVPLSPGENPYGNETWFERFVRRTFGKRVFGFPFIRNLRPLTIDRVVKKNTSDGGSETDLSKQLSASFVKRYGLYGEILRPTHHKDIDTKDGVRFSANSYAIIEVTNPEPAFTIYSDSFLQTISEIISGFVSSKIIRMTWEFYKRKGRDGNKFDATEIAELNLLLGALGVKVIQFTMSDPQLAASIQTALEKRKTAQETSAARRLEGEGEKDYRISIGEGDAKVIERVAKAKASRFEELITLYIKNGWSNREAVDKANAMIVAEFNADAIGRLTGTYVAGGAGVQMAIPTGGRR